MRRSSTVSGRAPPSLRRISVATHPADSRSAADLVSLVIIGTVADPTAGTAMTRRVLVIGGSVGGLFAANLLRAAGWDVAVFERAAGDLGDRGTGIGTREELFAVMRRLGIAVDANIGVAVEGRTGLDRDGRAIHELPTPAVTSAWARIWRPLKALLPERCYRGGTAVTAVELDAGGVTATFADGTHQHGDLLVAADGLHSTVRSALLPNLKPRYAGYSAWRGVVEASTLPPPLHALLFRRMVFGCADGELMLSIPMPGPDDGSGAGRCHFVWFRPADEATLADLCTDANGKRHGTSIPPPLIRPELIRGIKTAAKMLLAPQLAGLVEATAQIILQPIFDLEPPQIVFGRIALVGDAAFVARPHVATGVMKAALDAEALADALMADSDIDAALGRYNAERHPYGAWLVARGRRIGAYFADTGGDRQRRIETLMTEYGPSGLIDREPMTARLSQPISA